VSATSAASWACVLFLGAAGGLSLAGTLTVALADAWSDIVRAGGCHASAAVCVALADWRQRRRRRSA
jgi:hypothetical protein